MPPVSDVLDPKLKRRNDEDRLGKDIIDECRVQLMLKFRFLDLALWRMDLQPLRVGARYPLATDAKQIIYDPPRVIARFQESFEESVRDYLHLVMHCIFRHPYNRDHDDREAWELTCDIIVENAVMDMCGNRFTSAEDAPRRQAMSEMKLLVGHLLPNKVYSLIKGMVQMPEGQQFRGLGRSVLNEWHDLFERDDHGAWPANNDETHQDGDPDQDQDMAGEFSEDDSNPDVASNALRIETPDQSDPEKGGDGRDMNSGEVETETGVEDESADDGVGVEGPQAEVSDDGGAGIRDRGYVSDRDAEQEEKEWEDISKQIAMNLETFSKEWGEEAGSLIANLAVVNRATYDYTDFLRQFMVVTEEMQLNMDEFDYIYFTYGMNLYGNMPLIEPLEYRETERVHDFVIAIDTSESVSGELVKRFIGHTFAILKSSENYASEVNIHLMQCDAKVQSDIKIKSLKDVDRMMEDLQIRGFGGTDFRPAFGYVDMLRKRGELANMKGLIYFTDGLGQFPEKTPDYQAAFVFMDEEGEELPPVPPWACKILMDEIGINRLKSTVEQESILAERE